MPSDRKTPTQLATEALQEIARHEKECSARWAEAHAELKMLSKEQARAASITAAHAARWEKVAFMVIGTVVCGVLATFVKGGV